MVLPFLLPVVAALGGSAVAAAVVEIGFSILLSTVANALFGPKQAGLEATAQRLLIPDALPALRRVYGECRAPGTPAAWTVRGEFLYVCYILNSWPSALPTVEIYLDGREIPTSGDAFNLAGAGAAGTESPFADDMVRFWVSRGDQTSPPATFLSDAPWTAERPDGFKATDGWQGRTVVWARLKAGSPERRGERWVKAPPELRVFGRWSRVWDPRVGSQNPDSPSTWTWSDNHRLCLLDALRLNPIRPWPLAQLILQSFIDGANAADQTVALASGGTEPRYRAAGWLTFDGAGEVEDILTPLAVSGAADFVRVGGKLGVTPGVWEAPTTTLSEALGDDITFTNLVPEDRLVNELRVTYLAANRGSEQAELQPWPIPGALAQDGGIPRPQSLDLAFCGSATQAMRVRQITGRKVRRQTSVGFVAPPEAFNVVASAGVGLAFPGPLAVANGSYEATMANPNYDPMGESDGVAMRIPLEMVGPHTSAIYAWTTADEEEVVNEPYEGDRGRLQMPGPLSAVIEDVSSGTATLQRLRVRWDPSASPSIDGYEMQTRTGSAPYGQSITIPADVRDVAPNAGKVFALIDGVTTEPRDVRVRTKDGKDASDWREITDIQPLAISGGAGVAGPGAGQATFTGNAPPSATVDDIRIFRGTTTNFSSATLVGTPTFVDPGAAYSITLSGLPLGTARFWAVPYTVAGAAGTPSGPYTITIT